MSDAGPLRVGPGVLLRTVRWLPPGVVLRRLARPLRGSSRRFARACGAGPGPVEPAVLGSFPPAPVLDGTWEPPGRFHFLGITRDLGPAIDWTVAPTRLWGYHLHSLDALREDRPLDDRLSLLDRWIAANPFASCPGWESYPTSLRIVNAFEMLAGAANDAQRPRAAGLALQSWWLEANLETDLGANHLFKNALALAWAGRCLRGRYSRRKELGTVELQRRIANSRWPTDSRSHTAAGRIQDGICRKTSFGQSGLREKLERFRICHCTGFRCRFLEAIDGWSS